MVVPAQGDVLYLALEDNARRLQSRLRKLLGQTAAPKRLTIALQWQRLDQGGTEMIGDWIDEVDNPRLIVFDTLAKVRPIKRARGNAYEDDYSDIGDIQAMTEECQSALQNPH